MLSACVSALVLIVASAAAAPNMVVILADDLGWGDVSWNDDQMNTTHLAALKRQGVTLNQAYVVHRCSPTRSAFFTGYHPHQLGTQAGVFHEQEASGIDTALSFFPQELQALNYSTYMVGKWHLGYCKSDFLPNARGFDNFHGFYQSGQRYYDHTVDGVYDFWEDGVVDFDSAGVYSADVFTDSAIAYLNAHDTDKPFFLLLSYQHPHAPAEVPQNCISGCAQSCESRQEYCSLVYAMDYSVGQIVEHLITNNLYDDTIIFFTTDNGGSVKHGASNYPLRGGKGTLWEGGTKSPTFVHYPAQIPGNSERDAMFHVTDYYATILSAAGQETPNYGAGINQWPMILGEVEGDRTEIVYNIYGDGGSAVRIGEMKYMRGDPGNEGRVSSPTDCVTDTDSGGDYKRTTRLLFNLTEDASESINLWNDAAYSTQRQQLVSRMQQLLDDEVTPLSAESDPRGAPVEIDGVEVMVSGWC